MGFGLELSWIIILPNHPLGSDRKKTKTNSFLGQASSVLRGIIVASTTKINNLLRRKLNLDSQSPESDLTYQQEYNAMPYSKYYLWDS